MANVRVVFFDDKKVLDTVEKNLRVRLSKIGSYIRTSERSIIKYSKGSALAGQPPHAHRSTTGFTKKKKNKKGEETKQPASPLRELIFFGWDAATKSVVAGPTAFRGKAQAAALDLGGTITVMDGHKLKTIHLKPHPFRAPALQANVKKFPQELKNLTG